MEDIELKFTVKSIDGCEDEYPNKLRETVVIETQPPLEQAILDGLVQVFDTESGFFTVTIPKAL